jgi:hypothetical protein
MERTFRLVYNFNMSHQRQRAQSRSQSYEYVRTSIQNVKISSARSYFNFLKRSPAVFVKYFNLSITTLSQNNWPDDGM